MKIKQEELFKNFDLSKEKWKDIVGYEGLYMVSNFGRIKSLLRNVGRGELIMKPCFNKHTGYFLVSLRKNGMAKTLKVSRIVAKAFIPNSNGLPQVNHRNCIKTDDRVENLEWMTNKENIKHAFRVKPFLCLNKQGSKNPFAKLDEKRVIEIFKLIQSRKYRYKDIAINLLQGIQ